MDNNLSQRFTFVSLFRFVLPAMITYIFLAAFQMVDGFFIARYVNETAIAAVNLVYPIISLLTAIAIMLGTGGNAFVVKKVGEGRQEEANHAFSCIIIVGTVVGLLSTLICLLFASPLMTALGASAGNIEYLKPYYLILLASSPLILLQSLLGILIIGEGQTERTAFVCIAAGVVNLLLDYVFMKFFHMGIIGAAVATAIGYLVSIVCFVDFYVRRKSAYRFRIVKIDLRSLVQICFNGSSEMISNLATAVTTLIINVTVFRLCGEMGVSAATTVAYFQFVLQAIFMGFSTSVAPIFSYHFGSGNMEMPRRVFRLSLWWIAILTFGILPITLIFNRAFVAIFFTPGTEIFMIARRGLLFALASCLFSGFNIFASGLFTAFSNGVISAALSIVRSFLFYVAALLILPMYFGIDGLWLALPIAEGLSFIVSLVMVVKYRHKYHYL